MPVCIGLIDEVEEIRQKRRATCCLMNRTLHINVRYCVDKFVHAATLTSRTVPDSGSFFYKVPSIESHEGYNKNEES